MKGKNGFTLVELLAVIAILAILVIIALPNVISMYNKAQKQTFLTEARNVYREAEKRFLANSISGKNTKVINSEDSTKLDMNGKKLQYCVVLNNSGKVSDMKVSNGKWVASLNGKSIDELTIDDLEDGNLDNYECVKSTDESCFTYETLDEGETYGTLAVTIEDATKCKNYLVSFLNIYNMTEEKATTLCNGEIYTDGYGATLLQKYVQRDYIPLSDYNTAGISAKHIIIESVEPVDENKCKAFYSANGLDEESTTKICSLKEEAKDYYTLYRSVINGYIPYYYYEKAGLKVTSRVPDTITSITGYDIGCGADVIVPSRLNGSNVISISNSAFFKKGLRSVTLPNTLFYIGDSAFYSNTLTKVIIPESIKYIGEYAFGSNKLETVTYSGNKYNISFGNCPFYKNYAYPGEDDYCYL